MRWFVHVDMDAFYVSCELRERPELVGKAVAVGPDPHRGPTRGVVLSASYEARALGIRSAMPVGRAAELAPELIWIPPDFSKYVRSSSAIHDFLSRNAEGVTMRSIDEASFPKESESADELRAWARQTQSALRSELGLPCSIGAAPFRIVAKIASDRAKPGGVVVVDPQGVAEFLAPLPVEAIPGVGPKTSEALQALGIRTIGEIGGRTGASLRRAFGGFGVELLALARGEPHESSSEGTSNRSRSVERTLDHDLRSWPEVAEQVNPMAEELARAVQEEGWRFRSVTVRVRWADFSQSQRGRSLPAAVEGADALRAEAARLARELWVREQQGSARPVRTLSVVVSRLLPRSGAQPSLDRFR